MKITRFSFKLGERTVQMNICKNTYVCGSNGKRPDLRSSGEIKTNLKQNCFSPIRFISFLYAQTKKTRDTIQRKRKEIHKILSGLRYEELARVFVCFNVKIAAVSTQTLYLYAVALSYIWVNGPEKLDVNEQWDKACFFNISPAFKA